MICCFGFVDCILFINVGFLFVFGVSFGYVEVVVVIYL